jgi:hypothetical protein
MLLCLNNSLSYIKGFKTPSSTRSTPDVSSRETRPRRWLLSLSWGLNPQLKLSLILNFEF